MKPPQLLIGAALVLWGWQADLLAAAIPAAVAIEAAAFLSFRFDIEARDFRRIAHLCLWLLAGLAGYAVLEAGLRHAVVETVKLLPLAALPLLLAQSYSTSDSLRFDALLGLGGEDTDALGPGGAHFGFPYFALCLLGAAAANLRSPWFYPASVALCAWALWSTRPHRQSRLSWIVLLGAVAGCGYGGQLALVSAQSWLVENTVALFVGNDKDPYRSMTQIGHIGELKFSDRILVRLRSDTPIPSSLLLHLASYDSYVAGSWLARGGKLTPLLADEPGSTWTLHSDMNANRRATIYSRLTGGKGVLALPAGTSLLTGLAVESLKRNRFGTVRIEKAAPFVPYIAHFRSGAPFMAPPSEQDLKIPFTESPAITALWERLGGKGRTGEETVTAISDHFRDKFSYSVYQRGVERGKTPIQDFLERSRAGHCEYFATSTVLLLRAAGIPARYATGYSVQEYSELEDAYIIRARHAHAWARYYMDGAWHDLDTTPGVWAQAEEGQASSLEPLMDWLSWFRFRFEQWRASGESGQTSHVWLLLLIPLLLYVARRLRLRRRQRPCERSAAGPDSPLPRKGADSAFYRIEKHMLSLGLGRGITEPVQHWLRRLEREGVEPIALLRLEEVVALHYRYRFDPSSLADHERSRLTRGVSRWLDDYARIRVDPPHSSSAGRRGSP